MSGQFTGSMVSGAYPSGGPRPGGPSPKRRWLWVALVTAIAVLAGVLVGLIWRGVNPAQRSSTTGSSSSSSSSSSGGGDGDATRAALDAKYGSFTQLRQDGNGEATFDLPAEAKGGLISWTGDSVTLLQIQLLDASGNFSGSIVSDTNNTQAGVAPFGLSFLDTGKKVRVRSSGKWSLTISPMSSAPTLNVPASGTGRKVFVLTGAQSKLRMTHQGTSNFVVRQAVSSASAPHLLVNEIGAYDSTVDLDPGTGILAIQGQSWTLASA